MAVFCGTNVPLRRKIPFYEARFPAQCTVPHHAYSQTIGPARDCLPTCDTNGICVPDLRFDQHILAFYRAGSDRRIIAGYSAFRHGTRIGRSRIQRIGRRYRRQVGRILRAMQAQQQIARRRGRAQHDGGHCDQSHTGYGPEPSSDPRIQANQCFTRRFTLPIPFRPASHQMVANSVSQHVSHVVCRKLQTSQTSMHRATTNNPASHCAETSTLRSNARSSGSPCR